MAGLTTACGALAATFRGPPAAFWRRVTWTGLLRGSVALGAEPDLRRARFGAAEIGLGLASAGVLYGVFQRGNQLARRLPRGVDELTAIYDWRFPGSVAELAVRLAPLQPHPRMSRNGVPHI